MNKQSVNLKRRKFLFLIACISLLVALAVSLALALSINKGSGVQSPNASIEDEESETPSGSIETPSEPTVKTVTFIMPVDGTLSKGYSLVPVFNQTLGRYSSHLALDFIADEGADVFAVYEGEVSSVTESITQGVTVTIDHGNGLFTVYNSLESANDITVGKKVQAGDIIGKVSTTNRQEYKDGAHLHFQTLEDGEYINPEKYLVIDAK